GRLRRGDRRLGLLGAVEGNERAPHLHAEPGSAHPGSDRLEPDHAAGALGDRAELHVRAFPFRDPRRAVPGELGLTHRCGPTSHRRPGWATQVDCSRQPIRSTLARPRRSATTTRTATWSGPSSAAVRSEADGSWAPSDPTTPSTP